MFSPKGSKMIRITAAQFQRSYGHYSKVANEGDVVVVTSHGADKAAMISTDLLEELAKAAGREDLLVEKAASPLPKRARKKKAAAKKALSQTGLDYKGIVRPSSTQPAFGIDEVSAGVFDQDEEPPALKSRRG